MEDLDYTTISLPDFEGPLDLLLHLVKKHELDIFNIPISFITERYLQMLDLMQALDMDIAGEYLLMAATLAHIKSRELLPREALPDDQAPEDDEIDPRQALIQRLLQYQKYKAVAMQLGLMPVLGRNVWGRGLPGLQVVGGEIDTRGPLEEVPVWSLIEVLEQILTRARIPAGHEVSADRLSLADAINALTERLEREESFTFESCFDFLSQADAVIGLRGQVVITFMAILEMAKLRLLRIHQVPAAPEAPANPEGPNGQDGQDGQDGLPGPPAPGMIYLTRAAPRPPAPEAPPQPTPEGDAPQA